jgi:hypothetical protein
MEKRPCSAYCPIHARQGSRVSIQGMSRQTVSFPTVSFPTLCLLRQPDKAIGLESQIEPWLAHAIPCSLRREEIGREEQEKTMSLLSPAKGDRTTSLRHRASLLRAGAGCRKSISSLQHHQKCFFLTSPFIEHPHSPDYDDGEIYSPTNLNRETPAING